MIGDHQIKPDWRYLIITPRFTGIIIDTLFSENESRRGTQGKSLAVPITEICNKLMREIDDPYLDSGHHQNIRSRKRSGTSGAIRPTDRITGYPLRKSGSGTPLRSSSQGCVCRNSDNQRDILTHYKMSKLQIGEN
ncbi:hypothetical protein Mpal_1651 [Methanosphaerula palustris E1-9c]|uniref:Uncharacterized protein n=1 Tax=Methanosphaerula palustris (strain ATCC BAA-1556 / DSM 19958 / E1-9c) TaxID=521011 RepID=B8GJC2_METPE|nr:hypothetical protein Mpal_1651 [Methanosphaerula palustris E1-9c]